jgi:protein-export membrane protein SecD
MKKLLVGTIVIVLVGLFSFMVAFPNAFSWLGFSVNQSEYKLGLDLQGGVHLVYEADMESIPDDERSSALEGVRDVIERRVNAFGVAEPRVQKNTSGGNYRVIVELAGVFDVNEAIGLIGETPILEFKEPKDEIIAELSAEQEAEIEASQEVERESALEVLDRALAGENFGELASQVSTDDTTSAQGGYIGFIGENDPVFDGLVAEIAENDYETGVIDGLYESTSELHVINYLGSRDVDGVPTYEIAHIELPWTTSSDVLNIDPWQNTELSGENLRNASVAFDPNTNFPYVSLNFDGEGGDLFAEITERRIGEPIAIFLDGEAISTPVVQQAIYGGSATITGQFTVQEARLLAQRLNAGALPVPVELLTQQTVGPSLGAEELALSVRAALAGLAFVILFMMAYYRLPGVLASLALLVYAGVNLMLYKGLGVTLSLSGIAGLILSIGMAVDANVLIFERLKEELGKGRDLPVAIDEAFRRAWTSIRDGNATTLIAAIILFSFSTSFIRGFALTLGLGIVVSMLTAILVTRTFMLLAAHVPVLAKPWLYLKKN